MIRDGQITHTRAHSNPSTALREAREALGLDQLQKVNASLRPPSGGNIPTLLSGGKGRGTAGGNQRAFRGKVVEVTKGKCAVTRGSGVQKVLREPASRNKPRPLPKPTHTPLPTLQDKGLARVLTDTADQVGRQTLFDSTDEASVDRSPPQRIQTNLSRHTPNSVALSFALSGKGGQLVICKVRFLHNHDVNAHWGIGSQRHEGRTRAIDVQGAKLEAMRPRVGLHTLADQVPNPQKRTDVSSQPGA